MKSSFKGGVFLPQNKNTAGKIIEKMPLSRIVNIPLDQHIENPCIPLVKVGDKVDKGQIIANVESGIGCPVSASVSGIVSSIETKVNSEGQSYEQISITNDYEERLSPDIRPINKTLNNLSLNDVIEITKKAGIVSTGDIAYPVYEDLKKSDDKIKHLIINCVESEPYITANHRLLIEQPKKVLYGMKILLKVFDLKKGYIAIENRKPSAIEVIEKQTEGRSFAEICVMKTKYPQSDESQIIYALTGKELGAGSHPSDVGCLVLGAETVAAIYDAVVLGMPMIERIVTVDGDCVRHPKNVYVRIGTPVNEIIDICGGLIREPSKIIFGGTMKGIAQSDIHTPVTKGTNAVLLFSNKKRVRLPQNPVCIRCGRCVERCPVRLMPNYLVSFASKEQYDKCREFNIFNCIECGSCSYDCPAGIPIARSIKAAKQKMLVPKENSEEKGEDQVE